MGRFRRANIARPHEQTGKITKSTKEARIRSFASLRDLCGDLNQLCLDALTSLLLRVLFAVHFLTSPARTPGATRVPPVRAILIATAER